MEPAASIPLLKILNVSFPPRTTVVLVSSVFAEQTRRYKMYRDVHFVPCLRLICSCALHLHLLFLKGWRKISFQKSQIVLYSSDAILLVSKKLCEILSKISHSLFLGEGQIHQTSKSNSAEILRLSNHLSCEAAKFWLNDLSISAGICKNVWCICPNVRLTGYFILSKVTTLVN